MSLTPIYAEVSGRKLRFLKCRRAVPVGKKNLSDVRLGRPHPDAKKPIVCFPEASADFPAHVHLYQRKLLKILRIHLVEVGG